MPCVASANAGIGFFFPAAIGLIVAFIPVVIVEGAILSWRLRLGAGRGQWVSFVANLFSTVVGVVLGLAFDLALGALTGSMGGAGQIGFLVSFFLMFWISWWLETLSAKRSLPGAAPGTVKRATFLANLVSYLALGAAVLFLPLELEPGFERSRMTEAINAMGVEKTVLSEAFQDTGRFPPPRTQQAPVKGLRRLSIDANGRITSEIASKRSELDGKTLVYEPVIQGKQLEWRCYVPQAPLKYFPALCRYRDAKDPR